MNTPTPRPAQSSLQARLSDIRLSTPVLLGIQAGAFLLNVLVYVYDQASGNWLLAIPIYLLMPIVYVLSGILGLVQAYRSFRASKDVVLNAILLGASIFVITLLPPTMLAVQLGDAVFTAANKLQDDRAARAVRAGNPEMGAEYDALSRVFRTPRRVVAVNDGDLTLDDGHVVYLLNFAFTNEAVRNFATFANERLVGKDIAIRLLDFRDFFAYYRPNVPSGDGKRYRRIPVVIVVDGELLNMRFGGGDESFVNKYGPRH